MKVTSVDLFLFDTRNFTYDELVNILKIDENNAKSLQKFACEEVRKEKLVSLFYKLQFAPNFYIDGNGKPLSDNLFFNVSHSKGMVAFVMNEDRPIGVDLEQIRPVEDNLKQYVSSGEEYKQINSDGAFFAIWTSKESFAKCTGIGIKGKPKKIPALPLTGVKIVDGVSYNCKVMMFDNFVISITLEGEEDWEINLTKETTI